MSITDLSPDEYDEMISLMRADLATNMSYSKIINHAKKIVEADGRDFQEEFEKWKKSK